MRILLSNDDGIYAPGLRALYAALRAEGHEVRAVAPAREQSGVGSSVTSRRPLFAAGVHEPGFEGYAVDGTPADCVMLGLNGLFPADYRPDLVVSGINRGPNAGMDVVFSGTVGAALQGAMAGLPALAVSHADTSDDYREQAAHAAALASRVDWTALPVNRVYNLNYPTGPLSEIKGLKVCPQSVSWPDLGRFEERRDPCGRPYWWMGNALAHYHVDDPGTDKGWLHRGYITLTPLRFAFTDEAALDAVRALES